MNLKQPGSDPEAAPNRYFSQIYQPLFQTVERIAQKHTRGTEVCWEDATQVAFEKVWQATQAGKFRTGGVEEYYRWAVTVARFAIIDLVRKEKQCRCQSLDQNIPGTDVPLLETVADEFNLLDAVERADLVVRVSHAIATLDRRSPERGYALLWQGMVEGKNQSQLADTLGVAQGTISKRWKELCQSIAMMLGLLAVENIKQELGKNRLALRSRSVPAGESRSRTKTKW